MAGPNMLTGWLAAGLLIGACIIIIASADSSAHPRANFKGTRYERSQSSAATSYERRQSSAAAAATNYERRTAEANASPSDQVSEVDYVDGPLAPLYDFLIQRRLQRFCKLLRDAGLEQVIKDLGGSWTLFAPNDASFIFLPGGTLEELQKNPQLLRDFILYHFVAGDFPSSQIQNEMLVDSVQGSPLRFNVYGQIVTVSGAQILEPDLEFEMGRVYIIDRPLYPIPSMDILTYLQRNYKEIYRLVVDLGLADYLSSGTFTFLVPDDQAFDYLSVELRDALKTNISLAERILLNHIFPGSIYVGGITDGMEWETSGGGLITFTVKRGLTFANDIPIILSDVPLTNGVIHVINRVLLPEGVDADCHCKPTSDTSTKPNQVSGGSRPALGQPQRPQGGQGPTTRRPWQSGGRQTPRPVGGQPQGPATQPGQVNTQNRPQGPVTSPGQTGSRPWSPSRTGQPVRPVPGPSQATRSPNVPTPAPSDDDINTVIGAGVQPDAGVKKPGQGSRYPPLSPPAQRPSSSNTGSQPQDHSSKGASDGSQTGQGVTPGVPQTTRQAGGWSNRQRTTPSRYPTPQRGPYGAPTTRRPQTTRTYDWNQPRVTQPPLEQPGEAGGDSPAPNQGQDSQTQRPSVQTTSWQHRNQVSQTTRQPYQPPRQPPQPPQRRPTVRPTYVRPTSSPSVPSNGQSFESTRKQPNCRNQGVRVTPFNQNLPVCAEFTPEDCQNPPLDPSNPLPLCPDSNAQDCRNPSDPLDPSDNRPLCPSPVSTPNCRQFGQPSYNGDRRPLCAPSSVPQTGCKDPSAPFNPSDRRPVCPTTSTQAPPPSPVQGFDTPQGCRRPDEVADPQDQRPVCPEEPKEDCRPFLERPQPGDRRPVCKVNRQPSGPKQSKDADQTQKIPTKPEQQPSYPQRGQSPTTQTTRRQSWHSTTRAPQSWHSTTMAPQSWHSTTRAPQSWHSTTRASQSWHSTTMAPQSWHSTTRASQSWHSTTRAPQSWHSTTRAPQSWHSTTRVAQSWGSTTTAPQTWQGTTRAPQSWQTTRQPTGKQPQPGSNQTPVQGDNSFQAGPRRGSHQTGNYPSGPSHQQPQTGPSKPQSDVQPDVVTDLQPQTGPYPSQPGSGRYPSQPQSGRHPSQPQSGRYPSQQQPGTRPSQPQSGSYPSQPQTGSHPSHPQTPSDSFPSQQPGQPESGSYPEQPQTGSYPSQQPGRPQSGSYPSQPQTGSHQPQQPGSPHSGSYPSQPQTGSHQPQQPGRPHSGSYPSQPQTGSHQPQQPGRPHTGSYPSQPQTGSHQPQQPGRPHSGSYPSQPQTGSHQPQQPGSPQTGSHQPQQPGGPQSGSYPTQPQTGSHQPQQPGRPHSGSYPSQPQTGSHQPHQPGSPQSGSYPSQPQTGIQSGQPGLPNTVPGHAQPRRPVSGYPQRGPGSQTGSHTTTTAQPQYPGIRGVYQQPGSSGPTRGPTTGTTRVPISVTGTSTPGEDTRRTLYEIVEDPALLIRGRPVYLTRIFALFHKAGIEDILNEPGPTTVFLPSDDAFALLPKGVVEQLEENPELLRQVLLYHVTKSEILPSAQGESYTVPSVEGNRLVVTMLNGGRLIFISGAKAVAVTRANNGIFYVINQLLYPLPHHDIVGAIQSRPDLSTLAFLLPLSGLEEMLRGETPYTFLAPTDNAFAQLPQSVYEELTRNTTALQEILLNHIIEGAHYGREFFSGGTFPSARGGKLKFQVVSYGYQVNDVNIKTPEIVTGSGVIHLVDQILLEEPDLRFFTSVENSLSGEDGSLTDTQQPPVDQQQPGVPRATLGRPGPALDTRFPLSHQPGTGQPQVGGLQPPPGQQTVVGRLPASGQRTFVNQPTSPGQPQRPSVSGDLGPRQPETGLQAPGHSTSFGRPHQQQPGRLPAGQQTHGQSGGGHAAVGGQRVTSHGQRTQTTSTFVGQRQPSVQTGGNAASVEYQGTFQSGGQPNDVAELARSMGLNQFANWISNTGLLEKVHDGGVYTVFAPTDEAVDSLPQEMSYSIQSNPEQVKSILQYHIVPQRLNLNSISNEETASTLLQGKTIRFNVYQNSQPDCKQLVTASGTPVGEALATMGSIQVIPVTQVLYQPSGNLYKIIEASPILQQLNEAVKSARLTWVLTGNGPMTIFAPSDTAFQSLTEEQRKSMIEDKQAFSELLKRHIIRGTFFSSGIQDDVEKRSENNKPMKLSLQEGILTVNSVPVTYSDITATNGVLHVIDHFL